VSHSFRGNICRIDALCKLYDRQGKSKKIPKLELEDIVKDLAEAARHFEADSNAQGLGLTYNLMGRVYGDGPGKQHGAFGSELLARKYLKLAIDNFRQIEHYRGMSVTLKDLYDLEMAILVEKQNEEAGQAQIRMLKNTQKTLYDEHVKYEKLFNSMGNYIKRAQQQSKNTALEEKQNLY
jgi:hypothetical protein